MISRTRAMRLPGLPLALSGAAVPAPVGVR
ncbi:hypothetical protein J2S55_003398 [Streptosporangium brasiliense]|uniref:Uncharacterized protein n=1 Tax=Streptosporangium brasiliense TaxID=47480 RepID=A0ABT9R4H5_9ACTN|nr:hypothetical protein [Streptosporangium brasiliense]